MPSISTTVNQHYLDKVMSLAEEMPVIATEDIYDMRGNKLLAKGSTVNRRLQEKLIVHKLTKPIESSLCIEDGVDARLIVNTATMLIETQPVLAAFLDACPGAGPSALGVLSPLQFGNAMTMMLTILDRSGTRALEHAVTVALITVALAKRKGMRPEELSIAALAGLLHDIGELYIDPALLAGGRVLSPEEWAHVVVHPRVGEMLIIELDSFPTTVARAVGEHHERCDGFGYPRRLTGAHISPCGQLLAAAEMIVGLLQGPNPLERAELALKLLPGEHAAIVHGAVGTALRTYRSCHTKLVVDIVDLNMVVGLYLTVGQIAAEARRLLDPSVAMSVEMRTVMRTAHDRIETVRRAAASVGLDDSVLAIDILQDDPILHFELAVVAREINWRLRDLARDLSTFSATKTEKELLLPVIGMLSGIKETAPVLC